MTKTVHGVVHGRTIELDEDLGVSEGQEVEVQVTVIDRVDGSKLPPISDGLAKVYEVLGRRHNSGHFDTAERHNEHQP